MSDEARQAVTEAAQRVVDERTRLLAEIDGLKVEQSSIPQVRSASPVA